jgi:hypothetical protein
MVSKFTSFPLTLPLRELLSALKALVTDNFRDNPALTYIKSSEHTVSDERTGMKFNVKIIESLNKKPEGDKHKFAGG